MSNRISTEAVGRTLTSGRDEREYERHEQADCEDGEADAYLPHGVALHRRGNAVEALYVVSVRLVVVVWVVAHTLGFPGLPLKRNQT